MKIRFIADTDKEQHGAAYKKGVTVDLPIPSAQHWLRRSLAVEVKPEPEPVRLKSRPMMSAAPKPAAAEAPKAEDKPKRGRPKKGDA